MFEKKLKEMAKQIFRDQVTTILNIYLNDLRVDIGVGIKWHESAYSSHWKRTQKGRTFCNCTFSFIIDSNRRRTVFRTKTSFLPFYTTRSHPVVAHSIDQHRFCVRQIVIELTFSTANGIWKKVKIDGCVKWLHNICGCDFK